MLPPKISGQTTFTSMYYHNASSIRGKAKLFLLGVLDNDYDVIVISETWLTKGFNSEEYFPPNYVVHRKDRHDFCTSLKGGGLLIAIKSSISNELIACHPIYDVAAVRINVASSSIFVFAVYIPCGSTLEYYIEIINFINSAVTQLVRDGEQLMVIGDFNLPDISWIDVDGVFTASSSDQKGLAVTDYFASTAMMQLNRISNSRGKFLDLVFSTDLMYLELSPCEDFTGCTSVYHTPIMLYIFQENCNTTCTSSNSYHFDFRHADYVSLNKFLVDSDWLFLESGGNLNDIVLLFNELLKSGVKRYVPSIRNEPQYREPWYNKQLLRLEKRRNKLHSLYKLHGVEFYSSFNIARREFKTLNWFLYNNYILQIEDELTANPKNFWNFINGKKKVIGFPTPMTFQNSFASQPSDISNLFAKFFESVYEVSAVSRNKPLINRDHSDFIYLKFTEGEVYDGLSQLDVNKGAGHDGFPPILIKNCAESLAPPLTIIFNNSLRSGIFPDPWKLSFIRPIFKSGKRSEISNYRGIAILSAIPKLFESMVQKFLFFHAKTFISPAQHGFYPGRSTVTNLVSFCGHLYSRLEQRQQVDVVYTDFSKAFDKIDHSILIEKLDKLDCHFVPIKWLHSYLSDRYQFVKINDFSSRSFRVTSGVPQGSHIGPLLFSLFVNDVVECFEFAHCLLYADDMKIFAPINGASDCVKLQCDLDNFCNWSVNNKLLLNVGKCRIMSFYRIRSPVFQQYFLYNVAVDRVKLMSDLGITFSNDLTFTKHIDFIITKAYIMLGFIKRNCKDFCDPLTLKTLYVSFVRSILEYASQIWSPFYKCHSDRIESVQKQFVLYALRRLPTEREHQYILPPYNDRCNLLKLQRLDHRRDVASAVFVHDILTSRIDCDELLARFNIYAPTRCLRRRRLLHIDPVSTNFALSEPVLRMSRLFNSVYDVFDFNMTRNMFRNELFKFLSTDNC